MDFITYSHNLYMTSNPNILSEFNFFLHYSWYPSSERNFSPLQMCPSFSSTRTFLMILLLTPPIYCSLGFCFFLLLTASHFNIITRMLLLLLIFRCPIYFSSLSSITLIIIIIIIIIISGDLHM